MPSRHTTRNLSLETLRFAVATSLASDDAIEFCYWTLGYYIRRAGVLSRDIFICDLSSGHQKFSQCYSIFGISNIFHAEFPRGQADYASEMGASDNLKIIWYTKLQQRMFYSLGYHFSIFVDVRASTCVILGHTRDVSQKYLSHPCLKQFSARVLMSQIDEWLIPKPHFQSLRHYLVKTSATPLRNVVTAPHG